MTQELGSVDDTWFVDSALCTPPVTTADVLDRPDQAAQALTLLEPGGDTVAALLRLRPGRLSDQGLLDALIGCERQIAVLQARQQHLLAQIPQRDPDGQKYLREEAACALRLAPATTTLKIDTAVALTSRLRDAYTQIEHGDLSLTHGRILADAVTKLDDQVTARCRPEYCL
ncbi:MAG: hypothetical protein ACRDQ1_10825, partial [Sciscionella sp.]